MNRLYIGTKIIAALAMSRLAYNDYRGWDLPKDENGEDEGYLVEYMDGGKPNHPDHAGYISWSPKEQFEAAYVSMGEVASLPPHQQRVIGEKVQLDEKLAKLNGFFESAFFAGLDSSEQSLLRMQADAMACYSRILEMRISHF